MSMPSEELVRVPPAGGAGGGAVLEYHASGVHIPSGWTNVEVFQLDPARLKSFCLLMLLVHLVVSVPIGAVLCAIIWFTDDSEPIVRLVLLGVVLVFFGGFLLVRAALDLHRTIREWPTYRAMIADQGIVTCSSRKPLTVLESARIKRIQQERDAYRVELTHGRCVRLPKRVLDAQRLGERLQAQWGVQGTGRILTIILLILGWVLIATLIMGSMQLVYSSTRGGVILALGAVATSVACLAAWRVFRVADASWRVRGMAILLALYVPVAVAWRLGRLFL